MHPGPADCVRSTDNIQFRWSLDQLDWWAARRYGPRFRRIAKRLALNPIDDGDIPHLGGKARRWGTRHSYGARSCEVAPLAGAFLVVGNLLAFAVDQNRLRPGASANDDCYLVAALCPREHETGRNESIHSQRNSAHKLYQAFRHHVSIGPPQGRATLGPRNECRNRRWYRNYVASSAVWPNWHATSTSPSALLVRTCTVWLAFRVRRSIHVPSNSDRTIMPLENAIASLGGVREQGGYRRLNDALFWTGPVGSESRLAGHDSTDLASDIQLAGLAHSTIIQALEERRKLCLERRCSRNDLNGTPAVRRTISVEFCGALSG
jgi:hypothetical protein